MPFKPMLAVQAEKCDLEGWFARGGIFRASPKIDGLRCTIKNGEALTRSGKLQANAHVRDLLERPEFEGFDGELVVGDPNDPQTFKRSTSELRRMAGETDFTFLVFDTLFNVSESFEARYKYIEALAVSLYDYPFIKILPHTLVRSLAEMNGLVAEHLTQGYEGTILRNPSSPYKNNRSTPKEMGMVKVKKFEDAEAVVVGFEEEMANNNIAYTNELGHTARSSHQENKDGKGRLGALVARDLKTGVVFNIGTGFSAHERQEIWNCRDTCEGAVVKYKYFAIGTDQKPRHPVFLGWRDLSDMGA